MLKNEIEQKQKIIVKTFEKKKVYSMYRTTIYRLCIECQPERGIEWIYPANAFCIHRNYIIEAIEDVHRTRRHCRARESKYICSILVSADEYAYLLCMCEVCINTTLPKHNFPLVSNRTRIEKEEISSGGGHASFWSRNVTRSCVLVRIRTATHRVVGRGLVV